MKPFRSKLTALLKIRQKDEESRLEIYGRAIQSRQKAADVRAAVDGAIQALRQEIRASMTTGCSAAILSQFQGYGVRLNQDLRDADERLLAADKTVQIALRELQSARRRRETVEKFQAKERAEYDKEVSREEQKILDEMALRRPGNSLSSVTPWSLAEA
jgi:flagellar export protein FliJ